MRIGSTSLCATAGLVAAGAIGALAASGRHMVRVPDPDVGASSLAARAAAQKKDAASMRVEHGFRFTDRLPESGITFVHHIVDDAGQHYKAVHYDHGNGIAVADVDGDGLPDIYFVNQVGGNQLWKNLGGGRFANITKDAGVGLADRISVTAVVRRHRQRRRPGSVRHDGARRQRAVRERRARPLPRRLEGGRASIYVGALFGRGLLRLRQRRPAGPLRLQRRPVHDRREGTRRRTTSAWPTRSPGHLHPDRFETARPLQEHRAATASRT